MKIDEETRLMGFSKIEAVVAEQTKQRNAALAQRYHLVQVSIRRFAVMRLAKTHQGFAVWVLVKGFESLTPQEAERCVRELNAGQIQETD